MYKITQNDIRHIEDENALIGFLKEKLNLPIPEDLTLAEISSKFSNFALGLSGFHSKQVLDCQELSLSPGTPSGIFLIRFKSESGYSGVLHAVAKGLEQRGNNTTDLRFICMDENFQSFAFAYFKNSAREGRESTELNIFAWTQDNTKIHIASEHEIPADFLPDQSQDDQEDASAHNLTTESQSNAVTVQSVKVTSPTNLVAKLDNIGTPLITHAEMYGGPSIQPGCSKALVLDEYEHQQFINEDAQSKDLITRVVRMPKKNRWKPEWKHAIWISSSEFKRWPWSDADNEAEAERIFSDTYPKISQHIRKYKNELKSCSPNSRGQFYWELPLDKENQKFYPSKIIYPADGFYLDAAYDTSDSFILGNWTCYIPTKDLSLLAILNSKLFALYAKVNYQAKHTYKSRVSLNWLTFKKANMKNFPVADRTTEQKADLSGLVELILDDSDGSYVSDLEEEINQLVYKLYELTPAEITLIEKESSK